MKKEINVKGIKWVLDFKVLEEIGSKGKAQVSVFNLKKMANRMIEDANDTIRRIENGELDKLNEEMKESVKNGYIDLKQKALEVLEELNTFSNSAIIEFTGGCQ